MRTPRAFFAESKTAAKISHPNVLNLTDFGTGTDGTAFAVFEAAAGETLRESIDREGQLPVDMAVSIASQVAAALTAANESGVVHGNLSPSSILVASSVPGTAKVKVLGFGGTNAINDDAASQVVSRFFISRTRTMLGLRGGRPSRRCLLSRGDPV